MSFEQKEVFWIDDAGTFELLADPTKLEILERAAFPRSLSEIAEEMGASALVTGDSFAYTVSTDPAAADLPVRVEKRVEDIMTTRLLTVTPDQTMRDVVERFTNRDVGQIPVVAKDDPQKKTHATVNDTRTCFFIDSSKRTLVISIHEPVVVGDPAAPPSSAR